MEEKVRKTLDNLSNITTIPNKYLNNLISKEILCVADCVYEASLEKEKISDIDIGLGILSIYHDNDEVKYKFKPSKELHSAILKASTQELNLIECALETKLADHIVNTYKDFL